MPSPSPRDTPRRAVERKLHASRRRPFRATAPKLANDENVTELSSCKYIHVIRKRLLYIVLAFFRDGTSCVFWNTPRKRSRPAKRGPTARTLYALALAGRA